MASVDSQFVSRALLITLAAAILIVLYVQYRKSSAGGAKKAEGYRPAAGRERFTAGQSALAMASVPAPFGGDAPLMVQQETAGGADGVQPSEPLSNESYRAVDFATEGQQQAGGKDGCFPRDKLTAEDLLPKDAANSKWAQVAPAGQGDVDGQNFLTAGYMMGINTVGQSMRNANLQLRSDPPVPRFQVGPWNQSTIEYDQSRRHFEINDEC